MKYKLVAVDVDGTLLNSQKQVSERTKAAITSAVEKGVIFCISSGRPLCAADSFSTLLGIPDMPFILYNGALTVTGAEHRALINQGLPEEVTLYLLQEGKKLGTTVIVWTDNRLYVSEINERTDKYQTLSNIPSILIDDDARLAALGASKVLWYDELENMPKLQAFLEGCDYSGRINFFTSNPLYMEIVNKECSKALALEKLAAHYGIQREEIIAIGDGFNDLAMLKYAGLGIAMANAAEEIRMQADAVTLSNDDDGVAAAIEKFILGK